MKKIILLLSLLLSISSAMAQVLNQAANWPNSNWSLAGSSCIDLLVFTAYPTYCSSYFSLDDDQGGCSPVINVAAQSPIINLTNAYNAGHTILEVHSTYVLNVYQTESITIQYWDAYAGSWYNWGTPFVTDTTNPPTYNFCAGNFDAFESAGLR